MIRPGLDLPHPLCPLAESLGVAQPATRRTSVTTALILYRHPDHPWLPQTYVWQNYDLCPESPELQGFLDFWQKSLEDMLH